MNESIITTIHYRYCKLALCNATAWCYYYESPNNVQTCFSHEFLVVGN